MVWTGGGFYDNRSFLKKLFGIVKAALSSVDLGQPQHATDGVVLSAAERTIEKIAGAFFERERFVMASKFAERSPEGNQRISDIRVAGPERAFTGFERFLQRLCSLGVSPGAKIDVTKVPLAVGRMGVFGPSTRLRMLSACPCSSSASPYRPRRS